MKAQGSTPGGMMEGYRERGQTEGCVFLGVSLGFFFGFFGIFGVSLGFFGFFFLGVFLGFFPLVESITSQNKFCWCECGSHSVRFSPGVQTSLL